jgi:hypothetical protein
MRGRVAMAPPMRSVLPNSPTTSHSTGCIFAVGQRIQHCTARFCEGTRLSAEIESIVPLSSGIALVHTAGSGRKRSYQTYVLVKSGADWLIRSFQNTRAQPLSVWITRWANRDEPIVDSLTTSQTQVLTTSSPQSCRSPPAPQGRKCEFIGDLHHGAAVGQTRSFNMPE